MKLMVVMLSGLFAISAFAGRDGDTGNEIRIARQEHQESLNLTQGETMLSAVKETSPSFLQENREPAGVQIKADDSAASRVEHPAGRLGH